ncbi:MAG: ferredoxin-thioredoxin reductase catalytic domain-containing protein [Candidatus Njordarchaeales archaeon]
MSFGIRGIRKVGEIEISDEFLATYKKLLLKAAKKFFGEWVEFNSNEKIVEGIIMGELRNMVEYGHAYCPCRVEKIREHICPCEPAKKELATQGICHCRLFINPKIYKESQE